MTKAQKIAKHAFREPGSNHGIGRKKCAVCFGKWREDGAKEESKPPLYPVGYKKCCPTCRTPLTPFIPF